MVKEDWIIKILIGIIIGLISFYAHREMGRVDRSVTVLHTRVNEVTKEKADKEDVKRENNYIWKEIDRLKERVYTR